MMKALIVAAGKGQRINLTGDIKPKPLYTVFGKYLIEHVIENLKRAGISDFYIVVGFMSERIKEALGSGSRYGVKITYIENPEYEKANGLSVYKAKGILNEPFILSMSDHLMQPEALQRFIHHVQGKTESYLCTDRKIAEISDLDDATKVYEEQGKIKKIHKQLQGFNAIDCGIFYHTPEFFTALEQAQQQGDYSITAGVQMLADQNKMNSYDVGEARWMDIDTRKELELLEKNFRHFVSVPQSAGKVGVLLVGFNGGVANTTMVAAMAIARGLTPPYGLYTETFMSTVKDGKLDRHTQRPIKEVLQLADFSEFVFGGWDIEEGNSYLYAKELKIAPEKIIEVLTDDLKVLKPWPGIFSKNYVRNLEGKYLLSGENLFEKAQKIRQNIRDFKAQHKLTGVVVINVASTEVYHEPSAVHQSLVQFEEAMMQNHAEVSPAQTYAYAAIAEGVPYANFTPSIAEEIPALRELAKKTKAPVAGKDGKTGQTLIKTAVAPVFRLKNLHVEGWFSTNILGNKDGLVLDEPGSLKSKIVTKSSVLDQILGYNPVHKVNINYYPPRGDDKEAWDNIDFLGILGQPMQIKINFLCKDSILAAGSVLDLVRFLDYCQRKGESGIQEQLSFFFKLPNTADPQQQPIHDFFKVEGILKDWIREKAFNTIYR